MFIKLIKPVLEIHLFLSLFARDNLLRSRNKQLSSWILILEHFNYLTTRTCDKCDSKSANSLQGNTMIIRPYQKLSFV